MELQERAADENDKSQQTAGAISKTKESDKLIEDEVLSWTAGSGELKLWFLTLFSPIIVVIMSLGYLFKAPRHGGACGKFMVDFITVPVSWVMFCIVPWNVVTAYLSFYRVRKDKPSINPLYVPSVPVDARDVFIKHIWRLPSPGSRTVNIVLRIFALLVVMTESVVMLPILWLGIFRFGRSILLLGHWDELQEAERSRIEGEKSKIRAKKAEIRSKEEHGSLKVHEVHTSVTNVLVKRFPELNILYKLAGCCQSSPPASAVEDKKEADDNYQSPVYVDHPVPSVRAGMVWAWMMILPLELALTLRELLLWFIPSSMMVGWVFNDKGFAAKFIRFLHLLCIFIGLPVVSYILYSNDDKDKMLTIYCIGGVLATVGLFMFIVLVTSYFKPSATTLAYPSRTIRWSKGRNIMAVMTLMSEFFQLAAFAFQPSIGWSQPVSYSQNSARYFVFDFGTNNLAFFGAIVISFFTSAIWLIFIAAKNVLETRLGWFPIGYIESRNGIKAVRTGLSDMALLAVSASLFRVLSCTWIDGTPYLDEYPDIECYEGWHFTLSIVALFFLMTYLPSAYSSPASGDKKASLDIQFIPIYFLIQRFSKVILAVVNTFYSTHYYMTLTISMALLTVLAITTFVVRPCCVHNVNYVLSLGYLTAAFANACSLLSVYLDDDTNVIPSGIFCTGLVIAIICMMRVRETETTETPEVLMKKLISGSPAAAQSIIFRMLDSANVTMTTLALSPVATTTTDVPPPSDVEAHPSHDSDNKTVVLNCLNSLLIVTDPVELNKTDTMYLYVDDDGRVQAGQCSGAVKYSGTMLKSLVYKIASCGLATTVVSSPTTMMSKTACDSLAMLLSWRNTHSVVYDQLMKKNIEHSEAVHPMQTVARGHLKPSMDSLSAVWIHVVLSKSAGGAWGVDDVIKTVIAPIVQEAAGQPGAIDDERLAVAGYAACLVLESGACLSPWQFVVKFASNYAEYCKLSDVTILNVASHTEVTAALQQLIHSLMVAMRTVSKRCTSNADYLRDFNSIRYNRLLQGLICLVTLCPSSSNMVYDVLQHEDGDDAPLVHTLQRLTCPMAVDDGDKKCMLRDRKSFKSSSKIDVNRALPSLPLSRMPQIPRVTETASPLTQEELKLEFDAKMLVLGCHGTGKSTFHRNLHYISDCSQRNDGLTFNDKTYVINRVQNQLIYMSRNAIDDLTQNNKPLSDVFSGNVLEAALQIQRAPSDYDAINSANVDEYTDAVVVLWSNEIFRTAIYNVAYYEDGDEYLFEHSRRILRSNYVPELTDFLCEQHRTSGVVRHMYTIGNSPVWSLDVGAARSERRKWIHFFPNTNVLVLLVPGGEYDRVEFQDNDKDRVRESVRMLKELLESSFFKGVPVVVLVNKVDRMQKLLERADIGKYVIDFPGGTTTDDTTAISYFVNMFANVVMTTNYDDSRPVAVLPCNVTSTSDVQLVTEMALSLVACQRSEMMIMERLKLTM